MTEKKYVLITGATGGVGRALAKYLTENGYGVVIVGRNLDKLNELKDELSGEVYSFAYDLTDLYNIESIYTFIEQNGIKLDGMVHCAGMNRDCAIRANDVDDMIAVTSVNYMSFVELMKYFMKKKYSNDGASVVAISSRVSNIPAKAMCTYAASKAALDSAVIVASMEASKRKIRVNSVLPAAIDTEMLRNSEVSIETVLSYQPLGVIPPSNLAEVIEFLLSEKASYITGSKIKVDGGHFA